LRSYDPPWLARARRNSKLDKPPSAIVPRTVLRPAFQPARPASMCSDLLGSTPIFNGIDNGSTLRSDGAPPAATMYKADRILGFSQEASPTAQWFPSADTARSLRSQPNVLDRQAGKRSERAPAATLEIEDASVPHDATPPTRDLGLPPTPTLLKQDVSSDSGSEYSINSGQLAPGTKRAKGVASIRKREAMYAVALAPCGEKSRLGKMQMVVIKEAH
jgi:hypothetical protein